jgi:hypothetical protein
MALPADQAGNGGVDCLLADKVLSEDGQRAGDEQHCGHAQQRRPGFGKEGARGVGAQQTDDMADEDRDQPIQQRDGQPGQEQQHEEQPGLADEVPVEAEQVGGRRLMRHRYAEGAAGVATGRGDGIDEGFEREARHGACGGPDALLVKLRSFFRAGQQSLEL